MTQRNAEQIATPTQISERAPLQGVRIAITHTSEQAQEQTRRFAALGAEVVFYPALELVPFEKNEELDAALRDAADGKYDWLVLNDADTVLVIADRVRALGLEPKRFPRSLKVATIGCMTEQWTQELLGIRSDFAPELYTPNYVARELGIGQGFRVLLPQSAMTRATLAKCLVDTGAEVNAINAYRSLPGHGGDPLPTLLWEGKIDAITFTFPTAVRYFVKRLKAEDGTLAMLDGVTVACIGPLTAAAAHDFGLKVDIVPAQHTIEGLAQALAGHFAARR